MQGTRWGDGMSRITYTAADCAEQAGNAIATQLARLALAGHIVHRGDIGDFTVCKYGMTRYCKDFAELQAFARQVGVTS